MNKLNLNSSKSWLSAGLALSAMFCAPTTQAVTLLVSNNSDGGAGSLRQAIADNEELGGNTIVFASSVNGTITLINGELPLDKDVTIIGPGANVLAVNGNAAGRVFHVTSGSTVSISGLTIANGLAISGSGGGINNDHSTLTLNNCTLRGNSAGHGGGIYNLSSMLTLNGCTLSANWASYGGAIYNENSMLTVSRCTLSGNSAGTSGGGILNNGSPSSATVSLVASTLSGNSATYGCSIYNDGSGGSATLEIGDTILKAGASGENIYNRGSVIPRGYNLCSDDGAGVLIFPTDKLNTDPMLGPLQDNGGPTPTMMPLPGSPAIDQGNSGNVTTLTTDQRGRQRIYDDPAIPNAPGGDGSDIGAVEVIRPPITFIVTTNGDSGPGSLRQALLDTIDGVTITFAANVIGTIALTSGELGMSKSVNINGPGAKVLTVSGNNASRVFHVSGGSGLIGGLGIANGRTPDGGGGIAIEGNGTLTVNACTVCNCYAGGAGLNAQGGGGIYVGPVTLAGSPTVAILASTICSNTTPYYGGGLMLNRGTVSMVNCTVTGNRTFDNSDIESGGGGIFVNNDALYLTSSTVANNTSGGNGGGVYLYKGYATVGNSLIAGNSAASALAGPDCTGQLPAVLNWGAVTSTGYNLIGKTNRCTGFSATSHDLLGSTAAPLDPQLGPLQDNGGPTLTMALFTTSPAVDAGGSGGPVNDQRGKSRPFDFPSVPNAPGGNGSDIGAFEVNPPEASIVRVGNNVVISWPSYYVGYIVQSTTDPSLLTGWSPVPGTPALVGDHYTLTVAINLLPTWYRLKAP